jgi:hypothetical protein
MAAKMAHVVLANAEKYQALWFMANIKPKPSAPRKKHKGSS